MSRRMFVFYTLFMPRVSDAHLEARRRQILEAARACFAANGFHSTSMQDILRESGLSAGAVYRYFDSKEAIIAAIAAEAVSVIGAAFSADGDDDVPLLTLVERAVRAVDERAESDDVGRLALQVWAEAGRSDPLRAHISAAVHEARAPLERRLERAHPGIDAAATAAVITALLPGYIHARVVVGGMDPDRYLRGIEGLVRAAG